jgi:hypothetical protein
MAVRNLGRPFVRLVLDAYAQDRIALATASDYLGVKIRHLSRIESLVFGREARRLSYCIDTNVFIDAGERYYPIDIVPGFWENVDGLIAADRMKAPEMLIEELERKDDAWRQWVYERKETLIVPMDLPQIEAVRQVMAVYAAEASTPTESPATRSSLRWRWPMG